jgi:hypothetical protein
MFSSIRPRRTAAIARSVLLPVFVLTFSTLPQRTLAAQQTESKSTQTKTATKQKSAGTKAKQSQGASAAPAPKPAKPARPEPVWPVAGPAPLPGSLFPAKRVIAFYGNPLSKKMGILGEIAPDQMLAKLDREVAAWNKADPSTPAVPALHLIVSVAQGAPGRDGGYRLRMADTLIERVYSWAQKRNALLFLDVQVGASTVQAELPRLLPYLKRPNVHLALDPEFSMHGDRTGVVPGKKIGTMDAATINWATEQLAQLVTANKLPPKVLVVHRFTRKMVTNSKGIRLDPRVQFVMDMDGWGPPWLKRDSYRDYIYEEPVQFTGFKMFYKNDTKKGNPLMAPSEVLALKPKPVYIQYQ